jgi:hypothetical protein
MSCATGHNVATAATLQPPTRGAGRLPETGTGTRGEGGAEAEAEAGRETAGHFLSEVWRIFLEEGLEAVFGRLRAKKGGEKPRAWGVVCVWGMGGPRGSGGTS